MLALFGDYLAHAWSDALSLCYRNLLSRENDCSTLISSPAVEELMPVTAFQDCCGPHFSISHSWTGQRHCESPGIRESSEFSLNPAPH